MKRLRKNHTVRFFQSGEYTDPPELRPHHHACLFGIDFSDDRKYFKTTAHNHVLYRSDELEDTWKNGYVTVGDITYDSAAYVAKYVLKKRTGPQSAAHYRGRPPEYSTMSRRPGLASKWIDRYLNETYRDDYVVVNGGKLPPPKYYDNRFELSGGDIEALRASRRRRARRFKSNNTPRRLKDREEYTIRRINFFSNDNLQKEQLLWTNGPSSDS